MTKLANLIEGAFLSHRNGQFAEAEKLYQEVLKLDQNHEGALVHLGTLYMQVGRPDRARPTLEKALLSNPKNPSTLNNLGALLFKQNLIMEAIERYQEALQWRPDYPEALNNLGTALAKTRQIDNALACFHKALQLRPDYPLAHCNLANTFSEVNRENEALVHYLETLRLQPANGDAIYGLGIVLRRLNRIPEAIKYYRQSLEYSPDNPGLHNNLGTLLRDNAEPEAALIAYNRALILKPNYPEAHLNQGSALRDLGRGDEARAAFLKALELNPSLCEAHINLGASYQDIGHWQEARMHCDKAIELNPQSINALWNKALLLLGLGEYEEGWRLHECGLGINDKRGPLLFQNRRWQGQEIRGKRLLLWSEQGFGDTLQFIRYAEACKQRGAIVHLLCPPPLKRLLSSNPFLDKVVIDAFENDFDYHCPLMSLPHLLGTTLSTIPHKTPYLFVSEDAARKAEPHFSETPQMKVGLVWAGSPRKTQIHAHLIDQRRSVSLKTLEPLLSLAHVQFYSLQLEKSESDLTFASQNNIKDVMDNVTDFMDTAALVEKLDLLIAVDTSVVHVAGALGKPVWVLSRFDGCWRWLNNREDSPWYPSARVFGQRKPGDWQEVVERVKNELLALLDARENKAS